MIKKQSKICHKFLTFQGKTDSDKNQYIWNNYPRFGIKEIIFKYLHSSDNTELHK